MDTPDGIVDLLADADHSEQPPGPWRPLDVDRVGVVSARRPQPAGLAVLAASENANITPERRHEYRTRFVHQHLAPGEYDRLTVAMFDGDLPANTAERLVEALAEWGTARPTKPSGPSRR